MKTVVHDLFFDLWPDALSLFVANCIIDTTLAIKVVFGVPLLCIHSELQKLTRWWTGGPGGEAPGGNPEA